MAWLKFNQSIFYDLVQPIRIPMDNADKKRLLKEMILYRRYEESTFEAYMERKIGGFLHLYSGGGLKLVSSLCTEMSS